MPRPTTKKGALRIGVDTGGTFTDLVFQGEARLETGKVPSTPEDPSRAVLDGMDALAEALGDGARRAEVIHGTTVALNAVLTGSTARVALVTNAGFRDLIEIGRQERPDIYALAPRKPTQLVPRDLRFELGQRTWPDGSGGWVEVARPTDAELARLAKRIRAADVESVAVCLLHSYADPAIEARVARALALTGVPVTCSAAILRAHREVERFSTAIVNAALVPVMRDYLERLSASLAVSRLSILQSSGGTLVAERAALEPARVLFSGPAGGVVGASRAAAEAGFENIVTLDMGGTSTDVAFHSPAAGLANTVTDARVGGHPVAVPTLDIHTIGCGGGSLVTVDAGGILRVGPESAGADPGPVCYGRGEQPTVTDAHVLLGHIAPVGFLDGSFPLDADAVERAFESIGARLGVRPRAAAQGVLDVARAAMRRAIGVMTMQRGHDPRELPLVAFGGAGGLSAAALAASLEMPGALVPALPGVLSAYGMATADAVRDHNLSVLEPLPRWSATRRKRALAELSRLGRDELREAGHSARVIEFETTLDLRYLGQSFDLPVPEGPRVREAFETRHERRFGWRLDDSEIELVGLRARAIVRADCRAVRGGRRRPAPGKARVGERRAWFGKAYTAARIDRSRLFPGHVFDGPAIVEEFSGTTLVPPGWRAEVLAGGHLWLTEPDRGSRTAVPVPRSGM